MEQLAREESCIAPDLSGAHLSRAYLRQAHLIATNLKALLENQ
jgi:uncharacterized protein YjbI with pentapeptide repeats